MVPFLSAAETLASAERTIRAHCSEPLEYLRTSESTRDIVAYSHAQLVVVREDPAAWDAAHAAREAALDARMGVPGLDVLSALFGDP